MDAWWMSASNIILQLHALTISLSYTFLCIIGSKTRVQCLVQVTLEDAHDLGTLLWFSSVWDWVYYGRCWRKYNQCDDYGVGNHSNVFCSSFYPWMSWVAQRNGKISYGNNSHHFHYCCWVSFFPLLGATSRETHVFFSCHSNIYRAGCVLLSEPTAWKKRNKGKWRRKPTFPPTYVSW